MGVQISAILGSVKAVAHGLGALGTVHEILAELGEPPEVTPPPFGPTLFQTGSA
jgi:hypothetical protein